MPDKYLMTGISNSPNVIDTFDLPQWYLQIHISNKLNNVVHEMFRGM